MKTILNITLLVYAIAVASYAYGRSVTVPVISVQPIEIAEAQLVKRSHCPVIASGYNDGKRGTRIGQVVGGLIGSMIGNSESDRRVGTAIGVMVGGDIGKRWNSNRPGVEYTEHCNVGYSNQVQRMVHGYKVTYKYHGRLSTVLMDYNPGSFITLTTSTSIR
jgi:uncharacterized protein YcfJ